MWRLGLAAIVGALVYAAVAQSAGPPWTYQTLPYDRADVNQDGVAVFSDAQMVVGSINYHATQTAEATLTPTVTNTPVPTFTPTATPTTSSLLDSLINNRGDHATAHEIVLADPMGCCYSWGQHATEDTKSISGSHSANAWIVAFRNNGESTAPRIAIKNLTLWVLIGGTWMQCYSGNLNGEWLKSSNADTSDDYQDIATQVESDGSLSFIAPVAPRAVHMGQNTPGCTFSGSQGVAAIVTARIVSGAGTWGMAAGSDYRNTDGSGCCTQAGWGHLILLTSAYKTGTMLSTTLSDAGVRANPPLLP